MFFAVNSFPEHKRVGRFLDLCCFPGAQGLGGTARCQFDAIPVKIPTDIFVEINRLDSKIYTEMERAKNSQGNYEQQQTLI